jgi:hypothetical protein
VDAADDSASSGDAGKGVGRGRDSGHTRDASPAGDAAGDGAEDALEDGAAADSSSAGCFDPTFPKGGNLLGCSLAVCPPGTVCVQQDMDVGATGKCVAIPSSCGGTPSCACMEPVAQQCIEPGSPPVPDGSLFRCEDQKNDAGAPFLEFPCGCAAPPPPSR